MNPLIQLKKNHPTVPQAAVGAVVFKGEKILLIKRNKAPNDGQWAIPGGSVELGETLQAAAEREIREETGLMIKAKDPIHTFDFIERDPEGDVRFHYVIVDLSADLIGGELHPSDDAAEAGWFSAEEIDSAPITQTTREFLKKISFVD